MRIRFWLRPLLALALIAGAVAVASAQETTGTLTGTVKDTSGAVIPGVSVTARNTATNVSTTVVSDQSGVYTIPLLPPGNYEVAAELSAFKKFVRPAIELHVTDRLKIDVPLEAGSLSETD